MRTPSPASSPPLTVNGKIDRRALPVLAAAAPSAGPASLLERRIATVFGRLLGRADIPPTESFFELGATSVLLIEAHGRLRDELRRNCLLHGVRRDEQEPSKPRQSRSGSPVAMQKYHSVRELTRQGSSALAIAPRLLRYNI
ncbi:phosphopantetheine-binding protein [Rhodoplanes sp. SY1]|uniref:phosphopantetheine-binding protein n=1 Tax=Rhodoplanes sp. SY1 TaxID=3166646 RepID=UPI0038B4ACE2